MRFKSKIMLLILLLSFLTLTNTIYATNLNDSTNTDNIKTNSNEYQKNVIDTDSEIKKMDIKTDKELRDNFTYIEKSEEKYFELNLKQRTYNLRKTFDTAINNSVEKVITINGNNSIINGNNGTDFAYVFQKVTLIINNLTIINMNHDFGGAIHNSGTLTINNCTFENNTVTSLFDEYIPISDRNGNGIIFNNGKVNIINTTFKNNNAIVGSAIYTKNELNNVSEVMINNCIFENNKAIDKSTIYNMGSTCIINNSILTNNTSENGATISNELGSMQINNTLITNENSSYILNNNDECYLYNLTVTDNNIQDLINNYRDMFLNYSNIHNNQANRILVNKHLMHISNSVISDNTVNEVVINEFNATLDDTIITQNTILNALINNGNEEVQTNPDSTNQTQIILELNNSTISNNIISNISVIYNANEQSITTINRSHFINNTSLNNQGIINAYYGNISIYNSKFLNNTSLDLFKGNETNFPNVQNNEYLGNKLKSILNINYTNSEDVIIVWGTLKAENIYNITIDVGSVNLYQEENLLINSNIHKSEFNFTTYFDENKELLLNLKYEGEGHFQNQERELIVNSVNEEYIVQIENLSETFCYGDIIHFDIIVKNIGIRTIHNLEFQNLIPNNLILLNSSENLYNNSYIISSLENNENITISINTTTNNNEDLNLKFNIYDVKNDSFIIFEENITFLNPNIILANITAHPGELINISATVNNYKKETLDDVIFKFQYKEVEEILINYENNTLTLVNYKIPDNLVVKDYNLEIIIHPKNYPSFSNTSKLHLSKLDTYTSIDSNISNNYINITAKIFDSEGNAVTGGSITIKVNGHSIKSMKVINGSISLENLKIDKKYQEEQYELLLVYSGNNKYNNGQNTTTAHIIPENTVITVNYSISNNKLVITAVIKGNNTFNIPESGYIVFKINGKSVSSKLEINSQNSLIYDISNVNLKNITVSYYGNQLYNPNSIAIALTEN